VTDHELVERARQGDGSAFGELVARHHRAALRAAMAALGSSEEADDAVQDGWIAARAKLPGFRGEACFRTWLLAIVWNKARDRRRGSVRWMKRWVSFDQDEREGDAPTQGRHAGESGRIAHDGHVASPEQALLAGELQATITRLVRALPSKWKDPLLLVGSGEYTYEEVAAMLHQPVGTVKWRVAEARRRLNEKLARLGF
jgi:RNA polymerase sigma-70 factor, ECF subfamily